MTRSETQASAWFRALTGDCNEPNLRIPDLDICSLLVFSNHVGSFKVSTSHQTKQRDQSIYQEKQTRYGVTLKNISL